MTRADIVTDPAVAARLPKAVSGVYFRPSSVAVFAGFVWRALRLRAWRSALFHCRFLLYAYSRHANAEVYSVGPFEVIHAVPWLSGPARELYPEAFEEPRP